MILKLLALFLLCTVTLTATFELYSWILHRMSSFKCRYSQIFAYLLYCIVGGISCGIPIFGFEQILGHMALQRINHLKIEIEIFIFIIITISPIIAYCFFYHRHMASLKTLGYFLPTKFL